MPFKRSQLRYFIAVADEGQITRAAASLHIAQPALSQAIAHLEAELGIALFERTPRGVTLTSAGEVFLPKARAAVAGEDELEALSQSLRRATIGVVEVGFIGPPPAMNAPELFDAFAATYPAVEVSYRDLPFPRGSTLSWLRDVDVAFCHLPAIDADVCAQEVRSEPRAVVLRAGHPLAERSELVLADVLDETFISYDAAVQAAWAGFHSFDDHRGGPPRSSTIDRAASSLQMLGIMTTGRGITAVPHSDAMLGRSVMQDLVAIPVSDALPAKLSLIWPAGHSHPNVQALARIAKDLCAGADRGPRPRPPSGTST